MAQAPTHVNSPATTPNTPPPGSAVSYTKEKAKMDLLKAIEDQNIAHGGRQKTVQERYNEKVAKFEKRGKGKKEAEEMASKQIRKVWGKVFKDKLATPGTKIGDRYKDVGDSDGEGAIFLLKKFLFDKRLTTTEYLSHSDIESRAQATELKDEKMFRFFLDGGGVPGVTVTAGETKGLRSAWKEARMVADHHPVWPTSTTGMVAKMLELINLVPEKEKDAVQKFVQTIDIADSFLSKAGRAIDVEKNYAKTLVAFSYQLESDELFALCQKLPKNIGALSPLPDDLLSSIEVTMKWKSDKVKLQECVAKKQANIDTWSTMVNEKIQQQKYVTIDGKKLLIFWPRDNISNDVRAMLCAEHDFGTLKIHENGEIFMVHDQWIPAPLRDLWLTIRDVIFLLNPKTGGADYEKKRQIFIDAFPPSAGKDYLLSLLSLDNKKQTEEKIDEKKDEKETTTTTPTTPSTQTSSSNVTPPAATSTSTKLNDISPAEIPVRPINPKDKHPIPKFNSGIQEGMKSYGKNAQWLRSAFLKKFRRKKK